MEELNDDEIELTDSQTVIFPILSEGSIFELSNRATSEGTSAQTSFPEMKRADAVMTVLSQASREVLLSECRELATTRQLKEERIGVYFNNAEESRTASPWGQFILYLKKTKLIKLLGSLDDNDESLIEWQERINQRLSFLYGKSELADPIENQTRAMLGFHKLIHRLKRPKNKRDPNYRKEKKTLNKLKDLEGKLDISDVVGRTKLIQRAKKITQFSEDGP